MSLIGLTETLSKQISNQVKGFLMVTPSLYRYFQTNDMIRNFGDGVDKVTYFTKNKPDGAHMSGSIHAANIISPLWGEQTVGFMYLVGKIAISKQDYDKMRKGQFVNVDLVQDTIADATKVILNQVDQFLAWGDCMKDKVDALDKIAGSGTFTGVFNSGTTLAAGITVDNDVTAANDFLNTVGRYINAMKAAAHEQAKYLFLSDMSTKLQARTASNHFYSTIGVNELRRCLEENDVQDWMDSANFTSATSTQYRIACIAPKANPATAIGQKGIKNNFELYQGYDFVPTPLYGGGLSKEGFYEWLLEWSGRLVVYEATSIQHSGDLTIA